MTTTSSHSLWILTISTLFLIRALIARHPHSGHKSGPMFGDLEAQRHWMELTLHLPVHQWYHYDLNYWGLDYPPLTAYVSLAFGYLAHLINPEWVALSTSRGNEHPHLVSYMRFSVIATDFFLYLPATIYFVQTLCSDQYSKIRGLIIVLFFPTLIIIDHGHFQYNLIMLGLCIVSFTCLSTGKFLVAAFTYSLALLFKQMALYYAIPVFVFLLGFCFNPRHNGIALFSKLGAVVVGTFAIHLYPFRDHIPQVVHRIFPISRGLYEDKVANVWCTLGPVLKLRSILDPSQLLQLSTLVTLSVTLIPLYPLFQQSRQTVTPNPFKLLNAMVSVSLAFFLFSFQVHEKSILLPNLPAILLMCITNTATWVPPFISLSLFSLYPLLFRDKLVGPYFVLHLFWGLGTMSLNVTNKFEQWIYRFFLMLCLIIHGLDLSVNPPASYPHLFIVLNQSLSCFGFVLVWMKSTYLSWTHTAISSSTKQHKLE